MTDNNINDISISVVSSGDDNFTVKAIHGGSSIVSLMKVVSHLSEFDTSSHSPQEALGAVVKASKNVYGEDVAQSSHIASNELSACYYNGMDSDQVHMVVRIPDEEFKRGFIKITNLSLDHLKEDGDKLHYADDGELMDHTQSFTYLGALNIFSHLVSLLGEEEKKGLSFDVDNITAEDMEAMKA